MTPAVVMLVVAYDVNRCQEETITDDIADDLNAHPM